jgi:hypothetical protein
VRRTDQKRGAGCPTLVRNLLMGGCHQVATRSGRQVTGNGRFEVDFWFHGCNLPQSDPKSYQALVAPNAGAHLLPEAGARHEIG